MVDTTTDRIVDDFAKGRVDRRSAVKQLFGLGISAPAAYGMLGVISGKALAQSPPAIHDTLKLNADAMSRLVASPEMLSAIDKASLEPDKQKAAQILVDSIYKPEVLKQSGLDTEKLRTSMRIFEKDAAGADKTFIESRRVGSLGVTRIPEAMPGINSPISDHEQVTAAASAGSDYAKKLLENGGINKLGGVCVSYGKDLCVSAGLP